MINKLNENIFKNHKTNNRRQKYTRQMSQYDTS